MYFCLWQSFARDTDVFMEKKHSTHLTPFCQSLSLAVVEIEVDARSVVDVNCHVRTKIQLMVHFLSC